MGEAIGFSYIFRIKISILSPLYFSEFFSFLFSFFFLVLFLLFCFVSFALLCF